MIVITGGAGFIGSNLINHFLKKKINNIVSIDFLNQSNNNYFLSENFIKVDPIETFKFLNKNKKKVKIVIHLGAISSTTTKDPEIILENNIRLSLKLKKWTENNNKRLIYASSAATYGDGSNGFFDKSDSNYLSKLEPLNLYGWSKQIVDLNFFKCFKKTKKLVGLKFFNVYGPNEFHKGEMKSIILKIFEKIRSKESIKLFKSHNKKFRDGEQIRDFIYIKDVIKIIDWFISNSKISGLFNVGTGKARSFNDLTEYVFRNFNYPKKIEYIDIPKKIKKQYQYFTEAQITKLREIGYKEEFTSLEDGINDYIKNYLK